MIDAVNFLVGAMKSVKSTEPIVEISMIRHLAIPVSILLFNDRLRPNLIIKSMALQRL